MTEKMRDEFEAWILKDIAGREKHSSHLDRKADPDQVDRYRMTWVDAAWVGWQASRAALVVELPPKIDADDIDDFIGPVEVAHMVNGAISACGTFIRAAGVRVKS